MSKKKDKNHKCKLLPYERIECLSIQDASQKSGWGITAFDLPKTWQYTQGEGVKIAVIDSTPSWSPVICKNAITKQIFVLTIQEIFDIQNTNVIITNKKEEVRTVDNLLVWNGHSQNGKNWQKIIHVLRHDYNGLVKRICLRGGIVDVTPNHSLISSNGKLIDAKDVKTCDELSFSGLKKFSLKDGLFFQGNEDLAWFMGFFAAEGSIPLITNRNYIISLSQNKLGILEKAQKIVKEQLNVHSRIDGPHNGMYKLVISNRSLWNKINSEWIIDKEKRVPNEIFNSPKNIQISFLDGYNDGDGYHKDCRLSWKFHHWTTKSQILASGLLVLNNMCLDQDYSIHCREDKKNIIGITLNKPESEKKTLSKREIKKIFDIEYNGFVYDLETEDHTFGCGVGPVRVHNTGCDLDHPDLKDNLIEGCNFIKPGTPPEDDNCHGCVSADTLIHTSFSGIDNIESLYENLQVDSKSVTTNDGKYEIKDISDLKIHTYSFDVKTQESVSGHITSIQKLPIDGTIVKVQLEGGEVYKLTPWHPVYLLKNRHHKIFDVIRKRADEICVGDGFIFGRGEFSGKLGQSMSLTYQDTFVCTKCNHHLRYWHGDFPSMCKKCYNKHWIMESKTFTITEDLAYIAGIVLTDGHVCKDRFEVHSETPEILHKIKSIADKQLWSSTVESNRILVYGKNAVKCVLAMGVKSGKKSLIQDFPEWVGKTDQESAASFIAGIIDGDGCISETNTRNRITTASLEFANKCSCFLNSCGLSSYVSGPFFDKRKNRNIQSDNPVYQISFTALLDVFSKHLTHPKKIERSKIKPSYLRSFRRVKSVSVEKYEGYFYDFTVDKHHNYIANGHFVSNTHVTGILVAANNDIGMVGVCPKAKVMPIKVLNSKGSGSLLDVAKGVMWAADHGADIITMSLGSPIKVQQVRKAIQYAASKGIPTFVAAGNAGNTKEIFYPANYPETIAIGAIDQNFNRAKFSNTGSQLDFMAPGVDIFSTVPDNWYATLSGTCLVKGSYVYTPNGPVKIEDIRPNDIVFAWKSGEIVKRPVLFNIYRGKNTVHKIVSAGRDLLATETHEILTVNLKNKEIEWTKLKELTKNHKLLLPKKFKRIGNQYLEEVLSNDFCWLLGFFLGDGWISDTKRSMRVQFATGEYPTIDDKVKSIYFNHTGKKLKENIGWNYDDSTKTAMIIQCLGLNHYCGEKTIPTWLWSLSDAKINLFFDGYYSSDGWDIAAKHKKFGFECKSKDLIRKMAILSEYMGWQHSAIQERFRINNAPNAKNSELKYSSSLTVTKKEINGWSYLKTFNTSGKKVAESMGIDSESLFCASWYKKEEYENQDVYDLTVPDADCFVTNGIITHNSMACPFAVGVAALVLSYARQGKVNLKLDTIEDYKEVFRKYTTKTPENYSDPIFYEGFGIIDPRKMMVEFDSEHPQVQS